MMAAAKPSDHDVYYLQMECFKLWSAFLVHEDQSDHDVQADLHLQQSLVSLDHFLFEETHKDIDWKVWLCKLAWIFTVPVWN